MSLWQKLLLALLVGLVAGGLVKDFVLTTSIVVSSLIFLFAAVLLYTVAICAMCRRGVVKLPNRLLSDEDCSLFTVLAPLRGEEAVVSQLIRSLSQLDYPNKEVVVCIDEDDLRTRRAVERLTQQGELPADFSVVVCETEYISRLLKGKPKALRYAVAMGHVHGEFLVIYDAEDKPETDQLRKAATALRIFPRLACVQAELRWYNTTQNAYTRWLAGAYAFHFGVLLPGLAATNGVVPLGGTSNHFRVSALERVGWWDPFNVTEDLSLGVSLRRAGLRVMMLPSVTWEEATAGFVSRVKQESRWTKGHTATAIAHTRNPFMLVKDLGFNGMLSFVVVIVATHPAALTGPLFLMTTIAYFSTGATIIQEVTPPTTFYVGSVCLLANFFYIYVLMLACLRMGEWTTALWMITSPLSWWTVSFAAAMKAAWEVATGKLYYWDKTQHGGVKQKRTAGR